MIQQVEIMECRFIGIVLANRLARVCLEEAIRYARQRETFGQKLISHQVRLPARVHSFWLT